MIFIVVIILMLLFAVWVIYPLFSSGLVLFINALIMAIGSWKIVSDVRKRDMFGYFLAGALATAIIFIAKDTMYISFIFKFMKDALIIPLSQAILFIIFFQNLFKLCYENYEYLSKQTKEKIKSIKKR